MGLSWKGKLKEVNPPPPPKTQQNNKSYSTARLRPMKDQQDTGCCYVTANPLEEEYRDTAA